MEKDMRIWELELKVEEYERKNKELQDALYAKSALEQSCLDMQDSKLVSIIIPAYNVEKFLVKCLDSVRAQTYRNIEILVVDDGSKDKTAQICDCYAVLDPRVKVIHKENGGASAARNTGLENARGEYIYFLDSDDYIEPQLISKAVRAMEESETDWCGFWSIREDSHGKMLWQISFKENLVKIDDEESRLKFLLGEFLNYKTGWELWGHIWKRDIIEKHQLRFMKAKTDFAEDLIFSYEYLLYAKSYRMIPEVLHHYVQREDSLMEASQHKNMLPFVHQVLAKELLNAVEKSGQKLLKEHFASIYFSLMEWQTREYIRRFGIQWVKEELGKLSYQEFLPEETEKLQKLYSKEAEEFGEIIGIASVVVPVSVSMKNSEKLEALLHSLLSQSIQRLDILLLCEEPLDLSGKDLRIRQKKLQDWNADAVFRAGFEESYGEYVYFASGECVPEPTFVEKLCDELKYNQCSAGMYTEKDALGFVAVNHPGQRRRLREYLKDSTNLLDKTIFRRDIVKGLDTKEIALENIEKIILQGNSIVISAMEG